MARTLSHYLKLTCITGILSFVVACGSKKDSGSDEPKQDSTPKTEPTPSAGETKKSEEKPTIPAPAVDKKPTEEVPTDKKSDVPPTPPAPPVAPPTPPAPIPPTPVAPPKPPAPVPPTPVAPPKPPAPVPPTPPTSKADKAKALFKTERESVKSIFKDEEFLVKINSKQVSFDEFENTLVDRLRIQRILHRTAAIKDLVINKIIKNTSKGNILDKYELQHNSPKFIKFFSSYRPYETASEGYLDYLKSVSN